MSHHVFSQTYRDEDSILTALAIGQMSLINATKKQDLFLHMTQGLEGYFRDTRFDQNAIQDSGKSKII